MDVGDEQWMHKTCRMNWKMECIALAFTMPCEILHGTRLFMWSQCIQGLGELCGRYRFDTHLYLIRCTNLQNHIVFLTKKSHNWYMEEPIPFSTPLLSYYLASM